MSVPAQGTRSKAATALHGRPQMRSRLPLLSRGSGVLRAVSRRPPLPRHSLLLASPRNLQTVRFRTIVSRMAGNGRQFAAVPSSGAGRGDGGSAARVSASTPPDRANGEAGRFQVSPSSVLNIRKGDITVWFVDGSTDAIVNAANERMLGGGGVDGAIHRAAGPELLAACHDVPEVLPGVRCPTGKARITPAFRLPVSHVIHTVGPIYDADKQPDVSLRSAYRSCLRLAKDEGIQYIAFPAVSCGVYGYPYKEASKIAISEVMEFSNDFKEVHFVLFSDDTYKVWLETARELLS
uniref:Macro domain-containing protein XCC3184 n=1 Tax=Anthurium amnicola TaxID=1678845 RepID=A0A1D1YMJ3_9ARAE